MIRLRPCARLALILSTLLAGLSARVRADQPPFPDPALEPPSAAPGETSPGRSAEVEAVVLPEEAGEIPGLGPWSGSLPDPQLSRMVVGREGSGQMSMIDPEHVRTRKFERNQTLGLRPVEVVPPDDDRPVSFLAGLPKLLVALLGSGLGLLVWTRHRPAALA